MSRRFIAVVAVAAAATFACGIAHAMEGIVPQSGFGKLDHVFLIMMENESDTDVLGNPNAPFINSYSNTVNSATDYFAVGHPSAPNYLEIVGGSNFNVKNDYWPDWLDAGCVDNQPGSTGCVNAVPPITGELIDNPVVATVQNPTDCNGQVTPDGKPEAQNNCALYSYPAYYVSGKSIADQLAERHMSWKSYQESLPDLLPNAFGVNYADGTFSNLSDAQVFAAAGSSGVQKLYAVKHNPFAYFLSMQQSGDPALGPNQVADFDGPQGLWADLQSADAPNFSLIVPNQCHDMHSSPGGSNLCTTAADFVRMGDAEVQKLVNGIKDSPAWQRGRNAIIIVWDENDFEWSQANRVVMLVDTSYTANGRTSHVPYDHYSLLRTLEAGFKLPCLNHACDATSKVMNDMFGG